MTMLITNSIAIAVGVSSTPELYLRREPLGTSNITHEAILGSRFELRTSKLMLAHPFEQGMLKLLSIWNSKFSDVYMLSIWVSMPPAIPICQTLKYWSSGTRDSELLESNICELENLGIQQVHNLDFAVSDIPECAKPKVLDCGNSSIR